jgi:hypothetical protein
MIDIRKLAAEAASQFGLSLKDDPTAWDNETVLDGDGYALGSEVLTPLVVVERCQQEAKYNALSAVNRALGAASEKIATAMDVALHEDGPLADLDGVWAAHVTGLSVDLAGVAEAKDWQGRVDALRAAITRATPSAVRPDDMPAVRDVLAYVNSDPRFEGLGDLKRGICAIRDPGDEEPFTPPTFLTKGQAVTFAEAPPAGEPVTVEWDDEAPAPPADVSWDDEPPAPAPAKGQRKRGNGKGPHGNVPSLVPDFPAMLNAAGVTKADAARLCGFSESYIGYIFSGKKPWPGLKPGQVKAMRDELALRHEALAVALEILDSGKLLLPAEV